MSEAIYKGATRPAMKFGIPLVPLVLVAGGSMLVVMWAGPLWSWWVVPIAAAAALPTLGWMRFMTRKDDQRFKQLFVAIQLRLRDRNRRLWRARSYAPYRYRGVGDAQPR